jgi:hypothetical protein
MLRFTIRDVLWLTVVAALGVCLWVERGRSQKAMKAAATAEQDAVHADSEFEALRTAIKERGLTIEVRVGYFLIRVPRDIKPDYMPQ